MSRPKSEKMPKKESSGSRRRGNGGGTTRRDEQRETWSVRREITISETRKTQSNRFLACCQAHGKFHPACHSSWAPLYFHSLPQSIESESFADDHTPLYGPIVNTRIFVI